MLYQVGPVTFDTFPFPLDGLEREAAADFAEKDLLGRRKGMEFVGEGEDAFTLKGLMMPYKPRKNGLSALEALHGARRAGDPVFVMRGDGVVQGWFVLRSLRETHDIIAATGVGQTITYELRLVRVDEPGADSMIAVLDSLISLFG